MFLTSHAAKFMIFCFFKSSIPKPRILGRVSSIDFFSLTWGSLSSCGGSNYSRWHIEKPLCLLDVLNSITGKKLP